MNTIDLGKQPNTGSYTWVASGNVVQGRYKTIITYSPPFKEVVTVSGSLFRIRQSSKPGAVTFLSPQANENLEVGTNYT